MRRAYRIRFEACDYRIKTVQIRDVFPADSYVNRFTNVYRGEVPAAFELSHNCARFARAAHGGYGMRVST